VAGFFFAFVISKFCLAGFYRASTPRLCRFAMHFC
jgi:hypothetical protein